MSGFIQGQDRTQATLFPERLDDYVAEDSPVRVIDVFIDELDLAELGFRTQPNDTGCPAYHPAIMLKLFVYGYLSRVHSSRWLEREGQRNVELMWVTGRLAPDFKTMADFRKDNGRVMHRYWTSKCRYCDIKSQCTTGALRRMARWEHEAVLEQAQVRLERSPDRMRIRRATVEHPFGTLQAWMGSTHFPTNTLPWVSTEMSLHVLAYNLKRIINLVGTEPLMAAIRG